MSDRRFAYVVLGEVVHLRRIPRMDSTLCGVDIKHRFDGTGGTWLEGAPEPNCPECLAVRTDGHAVRDDGGDAERDLRLGLDRRANAEGRG